MTIKNTAEGDRVTTETMADRLRNVQSEPWRKLRYTDENEEAAWDVYNESLFLRPKEDPSEPDKGKGVEEEEPDLETAVPKFATNWAGDELLEAVSGIKKADREAEAAQAVKPEPDAPAVPPPSLQPAAPAARAPLRPRGGAAAARRGGRPRAPAKSGPSTTVNID
jgi:DNA-directed RNA polymerase-3 subunit RPC5